MKARSLPELGQITQDWSTRAPVSWAASTLRGAFSSRPWCTASKVLRRLGCATDGHLEQRIVAQAIEVATPDQPSAPRPPIDCSSLMHGSG